MGERRQRKQTTIGGQRITGVLAEIVLAAGPGAAMDLVNAHGGKTVYLPSPKSLRNGHWLVKSIGRAAAENLCRYSMAPNLSEGDGRRRRGFLDHKGRGVFVYLPKGAALENLSRRARIRDMTRAGESIRVIAETLGVTDGCVSQHRASLRKSGELPPC